MASLGGTLALAVTTSSRTTTIQSAVGAGTQTLGLRLGTANGAIITAGSKTLVLAVPLTELSPGSGFRKFGGVLILQSPATLAGGTVSFEAGVGRAVVSTDSIGPANAPTSGPFGTGAVSLASGFKLRSGTAADVVVGNAVTVTATATASRFTTATDEKSLTFTGDVTLGSVARTISVDTGSTVADVYA